MKLLPRRHEQAVQRHEAACFLVGCGRYLSLQVAAGRGWILSGPNKTTSGVPSCSYCLNVSKGLTGTNFTGKTVSMWRCVAFNENEANWEYDATTSAIQIFNKFNNMSQTLCLDAGAQDSYDMDGQVGAIKPFRVDVCNASRPQQQWFLDGENSGTIRSGLTLPPNDQPLYMVQAELPEDVRLANDLTYLYFSLYLSTQAGSTSGSVTRQFTFQPVANYDSGLRVRESSASQGDYNGNLVLNGGFESCTLLPTYARRNCSVEGARASSGCATQARWNLYNSGEPFSLCGWGSSMGQVPSWVSTIFENGIADGDSNSSILLRYGASINQTIPTQPGSEYNLSFSLAGYLSPNHTLGATPLSFCSNPSLRLNVEYNCESGTPVRSSIKGAELKPSTSASGVQWSQETDTFVACSGSKQTELAISAQGGASLDCGLVIDNVRVVVLRSSESSGARVPGGSSSSKLVLGTSVGASGAVLVVLGAVALFCYGRRNRTGLHLSPEAQGRVKVYSMGEIHRATKNLSPANLLGEGGFSTVYKANFPNGVLGAVKVEKAGTNSKASATSLFAEEVALLQQVRHKYLVNLIGICTQRGSRMLVFEYLPNGSLADRLHGATSSLDPLTWLSRMKIAYQVACALEYLHHGSSPPIVHRDVKSANILLTATNSAKLADFGLSKAAPPDATHFLSVQTAVKGSLGYLDPQYLRSGVFSSKSDIYSYGVVVLELITGFRVIKDGDLLSKWAQPYLHGSKRNSVHELVDHRLLRDWNSADLLLLVDLLEMCLQEDAQFRPTMKEVVLFLTERDFSGVDRAAPPALRTEDVSDFNSLKSLCAREQKDVSLATSFNEESSRSVAGHGSRPHIRDCPGHSHQYKGYR